MESLNNAVIISQEMEKISSLSIIPDDKKQLLISAAKYTTIPYMPMNVEFIEKYVLNNAEYPLVESKLSQAAIELKARINRLVDAQFNVNKLELEIAELALDIEDIKNDAKLSIERIKVQVAKKELEIKQKRWMINTYKNDCQTNFEEFTQWNQTIEDCIDAIKKNDPSITDFSQIQYSQIRNAEIQVKIKQWKQLEAAGQDLTPSQKALVSSHQ